MLQPGNVLDRLVASLSLFVTSRSFVQFGTPLTMRLSPASWLWPSPAFLVRRIYKGIRFSGSAVRGGVCDGARARREGGGGGYWGVRGGRRARARKGSVVEGHHDCVRDLLDIHRGREKSRDGVHVCLPYFRWQHTHAQKWRVTWINTRFKIIEFRNETPAPLIMSISHAWIYRITVSKPWASGNHEQIGEPQAIQLNAVSKLNPKLTSKRSGKE